MEYLSIMKKSKDKTNFMINQRFIVNSTSIEASNSTSIFHIWKCWVKVLALIEILMDLVFILIIFKICLLIT